MRLLSFVIMSLTILILSTGCRPMGSSGSLSTSDPLLCRYYATSYISKAAFSTSTTESTWTCSFDTANNRNECTVDNGITPPVVVQEEYDSFSDFLAEATPGITKVKRVYVNNSQIPVYSYDSATGYLVSHSRGGVVITYTAWDSGRPKTGTVVVFSGTDDVCENITRSVVYSTSEFVVTDVFSADEDTSHYLSIDALRPQCKDVGTVTSTYAFNSSGVLTSIDLHAPNLVGSIRNIYTLSQMNIICN